MANAQHLKLIRQGVVAWNGAGIVMADLSGANLQGANLTRANLRGANLQEVNLNRALLRGANLQAANLRGANLRGGDFQKADFRRTNLCKADLQQASLIDACLREANLKEVDLSRANLREADLQAANLLKAKLRGAEFQNADFRRANLCEADLQQASLIDTCLDLANLTGARLWETQRSGWSIRGVACENAFWDREAIKPTYYAEGEFEHIFAEKPQIVLQYPGGISSVDLLALPLIVARLQAEHPGSVLQVRSMQSDVGGATVTITVEDLVARGREAFGQELVRIQTKLECAVDERDRLQRRLDSVITEGISRIAEFLALPRQEIHVHRPNALTAIGGHNMNQDTYNISGQVGAVGPNAHVSNNACQQTQGIIDLPKLAEELGRLLKVMKGETAGTREEDTSLRAIAAAEAAASGGDSPTALRHLKTAGQWALGIAEKIGVSVATEALKKAL